MVLANEMRGSSSIYSQCNSRETRLQGSSANMSYYSVAGALHCCNNCRFNRLFHPSYLQILSPSEQLSAAIYFFILTELRFFYPRKALSRLTHYNTGSPESLQFDPPIYTYTSSSLWAKLKAKETKYRIRSKVLLMLIYT